MICFTFSGTGGHVYPCLAVAQELPEGSFYFICSTYRKDFEIVKRYQYPFETIPSSRRNPLVMARSFWAARRILRAHQTTALVSSGGYMSFAVGLAAFSLGIPLFVMEQNVLPGRVNRLLAHLARKVFVSFEPSTAYFPKHKTVVTGNPVRKVFLADAVYEAFCAKVSLPKDYPCLLVFGGSQGAQAINQLIYDHYDYFMDAPFNVIHISGEPFYQKNFTEPMLTVRQNSRGEDKVVTIPYFEKMDALFEMSDLVICRSGATTIAELIAFGKKAILVPYPFAKDRHQDFNADYMVGLGTALRLDEAELTFEGLMDLVEMMLSRAAGTVSVAGQAAGLVLSGLLGPYL